MKDINNHELVVGDIVATILPKYRSLILCPIIGFTNKLIKVKCKKYFWSEDLTEIKVSPDQVAWVDPQFYVYQQLSKK